MADVSGDGKLDVEEVRLLLHKICSSVKGLPLPKDARVVELIKRCDADGNGEVRAKLGRGRLELRDQRGVVCSCSDALQLRPAAAHSSHGSST